MKETRVERREDQLVSVIAPFFRPREFKANALVAPRRFFSGNGARLLI